MSKPVRTVAILTALFCLSLAACKKHSSQAPPAAAAPGPAVEAPLPAPPPLPAPAVVPAAGKAAVLAGGLAGISDVAERAVLSVVNVSSTQVVRGNPGGPMGSNPFFRFFQQPQPQRRANSLGSGVLVSDGSVVLTNNHVVANAREIKVTLHDGSELSAELVGADEKSDLAVLRIPQSQLRGRKLHPMPLGSSSTLRLGQVVLAIGNPFGVGQTVTMGIVSALGRARMGIVDYEDFIQTDAAINPGNSGGALVDLQGNLVGINTAILSRTGGYQGIGFSIPTDMARPIMESLIKQGRVVRGWLGVGIQDLTAEMAGALGIPGKSGVVISGVEPGSPAHKGGLQRGDVITQLNGEAVTSGTQLRNRIAALPPGQTAAMSLYRDGKLLQLQATLEALGGSPVASVDDNKGVLAGLTVESLTVEMRRKLSMGPEATGVMVTKVEWGSNAEQAGLREGDVVVEVDRKMITSAGQFMQRYNQARGKVLLLIVREGSAMYLLLEK